MIWDLIVKGGPVMIPILLGSVLGLAILFERAIALWSISTEEGKACLSRVLQSVRQGRLEEAKSITHRTDHPIASIIRRGLELWGQPVQMVDRALEQLAQQEIRSLERWLGSLATIITISPMLGFLGTITGLMRAFLAWEGAGSGVTVALLAGGIYEAMMTTAAGLIVAIPLLIAYNLFVNRIKQVAGFLTDASNEFLEEVILLQPRDKFHETPLDAQVPAQS